MRIWKNGFILINIYIIYSIYMYTYWYMYVYTISIHIYLYRYIHILIYVERGHCAWRLEVAWERNGSATQGAGKTVWKSTFGALNATWKYSCHWVLKSLERRKCYVVLSNSIFLSKIQGRLVSKRSSTSMWDRGRSCVFRIEYFLSIRHRNS